MARGGGDCRGRRGKGVSRVPRSRKGGRQGGLKVRSAAMTRGQHSGETRGCYLQEGPRGACGEG